MAVSEVKEFTFGKNLKIRAEVEKARFADELHTQDEYPFQNIVGINEVLINTNVGVGEPEWQALEENEDVGGLYRQITHYQNQIKNRDMHIGRLKKRLAAMGVVVDENGAK